MDSGIRTQPENSLGLSSSNMQSERELLEDGAVR